MPEGPVPVRLASLRLAIGELGLTHYLVPSADEHLNEYPPPWRLRRQWLSGFTGSAGDLLVGLSPEETWLFADGRYHLQAERELAGSGIGLQRVGAEGAQPLREVLRGLAQSQREKCRVGYDPMTLAVATAEGLRKALAEHGAAFEAIAGSLVDSLWTDGPAPPTTPLFACPPAWTGSEFADKVARMRRDLAARGVDGLVEVKLDRIAWLTNLRSDDEIPYNPVFESWLYLAADVVRLALHGSRSRLPPGFGADVPGFEAMEYAGFTAFLASLPAGRVLVDPAGCTDGVLQGLEGNPRITVRRGPSPLMEAKAIKNEREQEAIATANLLASAAKTRALLWLRRETDAGREVTERSFRTTLEGMYRDLAGFRQLSFATIAATGSHGAVVHYGAADDSPLRPGELFLVDSGIQLAGGTTDDTRTVAVARASEEQRRIYTSVLKAHIAGASQRFPEGATGAAIDAIVRGHLWNAGMNYDHGTGHGVGAFLNVHEGPFALAEAKERPETAYGLKAGMITSIEPGYYREDFGGVRLENLYRVAETGHPVGGRKGLAFVPLTWIPFDPRLIDPDLLSGPESAWLESYHGECLRCLAPHLSSAENLQLRQLLEELPGVGEPVA